MTDKKKPIDTVCLPGGMKATTWLNTSEKGKTLTTTTITRTFKGTLPRHMTLDSDAWIWLYGSLK